MFAVEDRHWWYVGVRREVETWLEGLQRRRSGPLRILDAGCGTGGLLANVGAKAWKVGIEISTEGIRLARKRGIALVRGSVSALPFADSSFDAVVSIDVLCHSGVEEREAVEEAARVLRPGGILLAQVPAFEFLRGKHDAAVWTKHRYRRGEVARLLSGSGLALRRSAYRNALLFPVAAVVRLAARRRRIPRDRARSDVRRVPRVVNALLSGVLAVERRFLRGLPFGLSVFSVAEKPTRDTIRGFAEKGGNEKVAGTGPADLHPRPYSTGGAG
jgi:SAM-dependent methyltransferase